MLQLSRHVADERVRPRLRCHGKKTKTKEKKNPEPVSMQEMRPVLRCAVHLQSCHSSREDRKDEFSILNCLSVSCWLASRMLLSHLPLRHCSEQLEGLCLRAVGGKRAKNSNAISLCCPDIIGVAAGDVFTSDGDSS